MRSTRRVAAYVSKLGTFNLCAAFSIFIIVLVVQWNPRPKAFQLEFRFQSSRWIELIGPSFATACPNLTTYCIDPPSYTIKGWKAATSIAMKIAHRVLASHRLPYCRVLFRSLAPESRVDSIPITIARPTSLCPR